jgi:hypothetical protein
MAMHVPSVSLQRSNMLKTSSLEREEQNKTPLSQISWLPLLLQIVTFLRSLQYQMNRSTT